MYVVLQELVANIESILANNSSEIYLSFYCLYLTNNTENFLLKTKAWFYYDFQNINFPSHTKTQIYVQIMFSYQNIVSQSFSFSQQNA